jgi:hypothetical protein
VDVPDAGGEANRESPAKWHGKGTVIKTREEFIMSEQQPDIERKNEVRIHIDQKPHESPNPTTGEALYLLGEVPNGYELYREVCGDEEDKPIQNGDERVHLKEDEHFHSAQKRYTIIVNGRPRVVTANELSFLFGACENVTSSARLN